MCTMTLLPLADDPSAHAMRLRIGFNRDESRQRLPARPPELRPCGSRIAIMPIDPLSGGTWIAVNDGGLAAALLNLYPHKKPGHASRAGMRSRGEIVPLLMECMSLEDASERLVDLMPDAARYSPFSIVIADGARFLEFQSGGATSAPPAIHPIDAPRMFTSSGLGDAVVYPPRARLFDRMFALRGDPVASQDAFHRHQWQDHPELSVCMSRPDARTVSYSVVELRDDKASLTYYPAPPNELAAPVSISLAVVMAA